MNTDSTASLLAGTKHLNNAGQDHRGGGLMEPPTPFLEQMSTL